MSSAYGAAKDSRIADDTEATPTPDTDTYSFLYCSFCIFRLANPSVIYDISKTFPLMFKIPHLSPVFCPVFGIHG